VVPVEEVDVVGDEEVVLDVPLVDTDEELVLVLSVDGGGLSVGFVVALDVVPLLLLDDSVV
jgi:hypothetical protein